MWTQLIKELRNTSYQFGLSGRGSAVCRVDFEAGLTNEECDDCEQRFGFRFPPDLRQFLQTALPRGPQFPDWRSGDEARLREWLDVPRQGVLFDVQHNGFWLEEWGGRPPDPADAVSVANAHVQGAPTLVPIFSHRMIPDEPYLPGNPVLSVHQTDIIYYGFNLADYLRHEFDLPGRDQWPQVVRPIRFWDVARFQELR